MKKTCSVVVALIACLIAPSVWANTGIFGTYIEIGHNGSFTWYGANEVDPDTLTAFGAASLPGVTSADTFLLSGGDILTFKGGVSSDATGNNITGGEIFYRVYADGGAAPGYSSSPVTFTENATFSAPDGQSFNGGGDQKWGSFADIDLTPFLSATDSYRLDIYFEADWSGDFTGTHSDGSSGSPYSNTFNFTQLAASASVPEPSTFALLFVGATALVQLRKKRK